MARDSIEAGAGAADWPPHPDAIDLSERDAAGRKVWLTPGQAAHEAGVDVRTIWRWIKARDIAIKIGGRTYINRRRLMS